MSSNANDGRFRFISDLELGFEGIKGPNYPASSIPELATTQSYVFALTPAEKNHFQGNYAAAVSASGIHSFLPGVTQQQQVGGPPHDVWLHRAERHHQPAARCPELQPPRAACC